MVPFLFQVCNIYSRPYVFARPLGSQDEGNWLVCEVGESDKSADMQEYMSDIARSLSACDGRFLLARFCVVREESYIPLEDDDYEPLDPGNCVTLFEDGQGNWVGRWGQGLSSFGFSMDAEAFRRDGRAVARLFDEWIGDPDTDISFARRWNMLEMWDRAKLLVGGEHNLKLLETLMRWTLLCEDRVRQQKDDWEWNLTDDSSCKAKQARNAIKYTGSGMARQEVSVSTSTLEEDYPFVFRMQRFLLNHTIPDLCVPLQEKHRCTLGRLDPHLNYSSQWQSVELPRHYTAHEQMEARLQLHDWLEQNAYPDEIEAIGPF